MSEEKQTGTESRETGFSPSTRKLGLKAREAARAFQSAGTAKKNEILERIAKELEEEEEAILKANQEDVQCARKAGMRTVMLDRLQLSHSRIQGMESALHELVELEDPIGEVMEGFTRPNGLQIRRIRVPLGTVGMIYEARPNVTVDAASLCIKTGNTVLLRGGKEAIRSNRALVSCMRKAIAKAGVNPDIVQLCEDTSHDSVREMEEMRGILDVLIPRGGAGLIQSVTQNSKVPVIETGVGNCHIYVDDSADLDMAVRIVVNAKVSRPSVCNAAESLLVHRSVAKQFLPKLHEAMPQVTLHGDEACVSILPGSVPATEEDYAKEYLDYDMSVHVVDSVEEAVTHIATYSTHHSEAIVTRSLSHAQLFTSQVDSAAVYVNASTRFTDGGEFGQGAEIGISTQKMHARGPMGPKALTTSKFVILGSGQIRE